MYECNSVFKMSSTHRLHLYNLKMHRKSSSRHYYINIAIRSLHEGLVGKLMSVYVDLTWRRNLTEKEQQKHFLHLALIKKTSWPTDELQTRARSAFSGEWLSGDMTAYRQLITDTAPCPLRRENEGAGLRVEDGNLLSWLYREVQSV